MSPTAAQAHAGSCGFTAPQRGVADESDRTPVIVPINEISFLSWAGGDVRCMNPFALARPKTRRRAGTHAELMQLESAYPRLVRGQVTTPLR